MKIVPADKHDFEAVRALKASPDEAVLENITELHVWLKDWNWPVARPVCERLNTLGIASADPVGEILQGEDDVWKYWILKFLLPDTDEIVRGKLQEEIVRIANAPSAGENEEEVNIAAKELLGTL